MRIARPIKVLQWIMEHAYLIWLHGSAVLATVDSQKLEPSANSK